MELPGLLAGLHQGLVVELVGDAEGADDRERVDARRAARPEDLGENPLALVLRAGVTDDLDGDLVAWFGPLGARIADVERLLEVRAVDPDIASLGLLEIRSDEQSRGARHHPHDTALHVVAGGMRLPGDLDGDLVAGGGIERVLDGNIDIAGASLGPGTVRPDEPEALRGSSEHADDCPGVGRGDRHALDPLGLVLNQHARADHALEGRSKLGVIGRLDLQPPRQRLDSQRFVVGRRDELEYAIAIR